MPTLTEEMEGTYSNIPHTEQTEPMDQEESITFLTVYLSIFFNFSDYPLQVKCNMAATKSNLFNLLHHGKVAKKISNRIKSTTKTFIIQ